MKLPTVTSGSGCAECTPETAHKNRETVALIRGEYASSERDWYLGFSGGKDSSAVLKLVFEALAALPNPRKTVTVVYCDTGVEIPVVTGLVRRTLKDVQAEAHSLGLPIEVRVARPRLRDRYFVKVIGRGYPTPTNKFRWCTDRLRINPVQRIISKGRESLVLLGVREGESQDRDRTLQRHGTDRTFHLRQSGSASSLIFAPILNYELEDVWGTLFRSRGARAVDPDRLSDLYKSAGADCPIVRDPKGTPCGKGRFGCWTCTVVRQDQAVTAMIADGYEELAPLLDFRNWLIEYRDNPVAREDRRRNGAPGPGPFSLEARREILRRLLAIQEQVSWPLIGVEEIEAIKDLWRLDE